MPNFLVDLFKKRTTFNISYTFKLILIIFLTLFKEFFYLLHDYPVVNFIYNYVYSKKYYYHSITTVVTYMTLLHGNKYNRSVTTVITIS